MFASGFQGFGPALTMPFWSSLQPQEGPSLEDQEKTINSSTKRQNATRIMIVKDASPLA